MPQTLIRMKADILKALAHPARLAIVEFLGASGERCVCEIAEHIESAGDRTMISKHLAVLRAAGLVTDRKEGLRVFYRLNCPCVRRFLPCIEQILEERVQREHEMLKAR